MQLVIKALENEDTLMRAQILCPEQKNMFLILFRNILCPQQMFPSLRSVERQHSFCVPRICVHRKHYEQQCIHNNVSSFGRGPFLEAPGNYRAAPVKLFCFPFQMGVSKGLKVAQ